MSNVIKCYCMINTARLNEWFPWYMYIKLLLYTGKLEGRSPHSNSQWCNKVSEGLTRFLRVSWQWIEDKKQAYERQQSVNRYMRVLDWTSYVKNLKEKIPESKSQVVISGERGRKHCGFGSWSLETEVICTQDELSVIMSPWKDKVLLTIQSEGNLLSQDV